MNRKILTCLLVASFLIGSSSISMAAPIFDKKFKNCAALNVIYPGGVSKSAEVVNQGGETKFVPKVNAKVYKENRSKDRDGDGIACER